MSATEVDPYSDIRPYIDSEVPAVIARLKSDGGLSDALARLRLAGLYRRSPLLAMSLARLWLRWQLRGVDTVEKLQMIVKPHLEAQIDASARFSASGLEVLSSQRSWLFISNHRDITMDPALTNYAIHQSGHRTLSIAIGDNLLRQQWIADLMRLNKSFIVKRKITAPRELLAASKQLSSYIRSTIIHNNGPVWIAQREGRAKDGLDATEPAVIKMLGLSRDKKQHSVAQHYAALNIVPVAISYELDPCDAAKAAELIAGPQYSKGPEEDMRSIGVGIAGRKGCVHVAFGQPLTGEALEVDAVVEAIDRHIWRHYRLFETNLWAWQQLERRDDRPALDIHSGMVSRAEFDARINAIPEQHRHLVLEMYANPLRRRLEQETGLSTE